jgi:hypothetical protein
MAKRPAQKEPKRTLDNIMVVLRESIGGNKRRESLQPVGAATAIWPDTGERITVEIAGFQLIGDLHIRFVFDGRKYMQGLEPEDLLRFDLSPERALEVALKNIKRVYDEPKSLPYLGAISRVQGECPDFDSSYFLDRNFWRDALKRHPKGLVVAVPSRSDLYYAPLGATDEVEHLRRNVVRSYSANGQQRVSSALFLFKEDEWTVFQDPHPDDA